MTDAFCGLTEAGSRALIYTMVYPWIGLPLVGLMVTALAMLYRRSRGLFRRAVSLYVTHWKLFVGIGFIAIPVGITFNVLQAFLMRRGPLEYLIQWLDSTAGARLTAVATVGGMQQLALLLIIAPAVVQATVDIHRGRAATVTRSYRLAASRAVPIGVAAAIVLIIAGVSALILIGLPIAIWLAVRWQFFVQSLVFDRSQTSAGALRESSTLVKNRWWKTLGAVLIFDLLATIPGVVIGFGLLTLGRTAVGFANSVSSVLYALTIPLAVIAVTILYLDLREEGGASTSA
jgi:hypothetical protein